MSSSRPVGLPASATVASKFNRLTYGVSDAFQRAGSVITSGLRSCDDTSTVLGDNHELHVLPKKTAANGATSATWGQELLQHQQQSFTLTNQLASISKQGLVKPNIWGDHTFKVSAIWQPRESSRRASSPTNNVQTDLGGTVLISAWTESAGPGGKRDLPIKVSWRRKCAGLTFQIHHTGSQFPVTADDVSCSLFAEVTSAVGSMGTAFCEIGPFDLDAAMSATIQGYLAANGSTFSVTLMSAQDESMDSIMEAEDKSLVLFISSSELKLTKPGPNNIGFTRNWTVPVTAHQRLVSVDTNNPTCFTLHFEETNANTETSRPLPLKVCALSRRQRDTIVLTIRAFQAQKVAIASALLEQIALNTNTKHAGHLDGGDASDTSPTQIQGRTELDFYLIFGQLSRQLLELVETSNKAQRERNRAVMERDALEKDIDATIEVYKSLLAEHLAVTSSAPQTAGGDGDAAATPEADITALLGGKGDLAQRAALMADLQMQLSETQQQAKKYLEALETLRRDNSQLKAKMQEKELQWRAWLNSPTKSQPPEADAKRLADLENQIRHLEQLNFTLSDQESRSTSEVRELRQVVERLTTQSIAETLPDVSLRDDVAKLVAELDEVRHQKEEAESNFLYIKRRYDELEQRQRNETHSRVEAAENLERLERSSKREVEMCKEKYQELEVRNTTLVEELREARNEIARITRERNTMEKNLERSRREISEHTANLAALNRTLLMDKTGGVSATDTTNPSFNTLNAGLLKAQLTAKTQEVEILRKENEELKKKLRKALEA